MELKAIYEPVLKQLEDVQEKLRELGDLEFPHLAELVNYSLTNTGKLIRPALSFLSGGFYVPDNELITKMATALEVMHIATLVHDDAIDHSDTRRGKTTVYRHWGEEQAVLLGDYLFAEAGRLTAETGNLRIIKQFSHTLKTISSGEIDQAYYSYRLDQGRDNYYRRIASKTAALFMMSTESGAVLSGAPERSIHALIEYAYNLGVGFQITDDILDFVGTEEELGKPVGSDLTQGTLTLPSLMILERYPDDNPVKTLFNNKGGQAEIDKAVDMVKNSDIIDHCYQTAQSFCDKAYLLLDGLPECNSKTCLQDLTEYIMSRNK